MRCQNSIVVEKMHGLYQASLDESCGKVVDWWHSKHATS